MFFFAALFVATFIISLFLMPKAKIENAKASTLNDFNFPRAKEGDPVPRGYGTWKTKGANTIALMDFEARPITVKVKTGLFSSKKVITGYKYFIGLDAMVALGPCIEFRRLWLGKDEIWNDCRPGCHDTAQVATINWPNLYGGNDNGGNGGVGGDVAFYSGSFDQTADPYLIKQLETGDDLVPAYVGMAHAVFRKFYWGNSPSVQPIYFELRYLGNSLGIPESKSIMANGLDANPMEVLYDLYVNGWGNLAVDPTLIDVDNWREAGVTVYGEDNGWSGEIASPQQGVDITKLILQQINAMIYQDPSTGLFKIKLIRADYVEADLPILGPAQIAEVQNFSKTLWEETANLCRVKFEDRIQGYKPDVPAVQQDFANIRFQKRVVAFEVGMPGVKVATNANAIAARELSNRNVPLYQAQLIVNREAATLGPGEVFKWNAPEYNIESVIVRVRKFGLGTREDGKISVFVVQDQFASEAIVYAAPPPAITDSADYKPHDIADYKIVELPSFLLLGTGTTPTNALTTYAAFAKKPGKSIDYFVLKEATDGDFEVLSNATYPPVATLTADVAELDGWITGELASITIGSGINLTDYLMAHTSTELRGGHNLFVLGNEFASFETFVDHGDGTYTLSTIKRALLDTTFEAHSIGDLLYFVDGAEAFLAETFVVPSSLSVYMLDRTVQGRSLKAGATITALDPASPPRAWRPAPPDYVTVDGDRLTTTVVGTGQIVTVAWNERNRLDTAIPFEDDATEAAEAATTYDVGLYQGLTMLALDTGVSGASHAFTIPTGSGAAEIRVWANRDTFQSYTPAIYPVMISDILIIDGDAVLIDTATIEF